MSTGLLLTRTAHIAAINNLERSRIEYLTLVEVAVTCGDLTSAETYLRSALWCGVLARRLEGDV